MFLLIIITASVLYLCAHLSPPPPPPPPTSCIVQAWELKKGFGWGPEASIPSTHRFVVVFILTKYFGALTFI